MQLSLTNSNASKLFTLNKSVADIKNTVSVKPFQKIRMMPIGVPKVAYRIPGSSSADWIDIYNRLYRERIIFLGQEIDDEIANQIIAVMLYLDSESNSKPIYLYINSPGGSVISGLALYDTIQHVKSEVITVNIGLAASMASFILASGKKRQTSRFTPFTCNDPSANGRCAWPGF
mmetsp:Transcript_16870/g.46136  ORF Transcript_16870/g.46136 Transcript_16870/m.46136 type:complete len:175 (-) Transcript_16870:1379-1903(-)